MLNKTPIFKTAVEFAGRQTSRERTKATALFDSIISCQSPAGKSTGKQPVAELRTASPRYGRQHHTRRSAASSSSARLGLDPWGSLDERDFVVVRSEAPVWYKDSRVETGEDRHYKFLVQQYKAALVQNTRRPKCNFSALLQAIHGKVAQLDNTELRRNLVRRKRKGQFDRCVWNIDKIIQHIDEKRSMQSKAQWVPGESSRGIDEMDAKELRESLRTSILFPAPAKKASSASPLKPTQSPQQKRKSPVRCIKVQMDASERRPFKTRIKDCIQTVKNEYGVSVQEWNTGKVLSMRPYEKQFGRDFFDAIHDGEEAKVVSLLISNPYLVYDCNPVFISPAKTRL